MFYVMIFAFIDLQCCPPAGNCPQCGGLVYAPGCWCIRCGRDER